MSINSREKGKRGERELANYLKDKGYNEARRGVQYTGGKDSPDVVIPGLTDWLHIECKRVENLNMTKAIEQAKKDADDKEWGVVWRKNRTPWYINIELDLFLKIISK